jgi:von Willebrand factor type A domain
MRNSTLRRGLILVALLAAALASGPGVAAGALTVTSATLDRATSVSTPPGGVISASVTTRITPPNRSWRSTRQRLGTATTCMNTRDRSGPGLRRADYDLAAPGAPGDYDAGFAAAGGRDCSGATSPEKVLREAIRVTAPARNPNMVPVCGLDVMLVLDESGSIAQSGATGTVRAAARGFLDALAGTGSSVSIVDFSTTAAQPVPYTTVTETTIGNVFAPYLRNGYRPSGWTNWEAACQRVQSANAAIGGPRADLVLFMTDGDPTAYDRPGRRPATGLVPGDATALRRAAAVADLVKGQGSHVMALGVGAAATSAASERRLTAVSGFQRYPDEQPDIGRGDYALVDDFDDLPAALRAFAVALCKGSVAVTKLVDEGDGVYRPDPGWSITAEVDTTPGGYAWLQPPPAAPGPRTATTDKDGVASFQWRPKVPTATSVATLQETPRPGYALVDWACVVTTPGPAPEPPPPAPAPGSRPA